MGEGACHCLPITQRRMSASYYIARGRKTLGPCTLDDLRNYLAYGSVSPGDLVRRGEDSQWHAVSSVLRQSEVEGAVQNPLGAIHEPPRRTVRYRDYHRVPPEQQSGVVIKWMVLGFLLFPPLLWRAAVSIYSQRIFQRAQDAGGYLLHWPRWVEPLVTVLIMVNALLVMSLSYALWHAISPLMHDFLEAMKGATGTLRELF
jgi:hypothetical protein